MALRCIDRIVELEPSRRIVAERTVRPDEEYFRDHFVGFPVLPGVLVLEGLVEAAAWLVRASEDFARSQVYMTACAQAKYSRLVRPGAVLRFEAELGAGPPYDVKGRAVEGAETVATARFRLDSARVGDGAPLFAHLEEGLLEKCRRRFRELGGAAAAPRAERRG
jgi:3-hydroxyacyl-[acyl-carrier-protein] dehydratase